MTLQSTCYSQHISHCSYFTNTETYLRNDRVRQSCTRNKEIVPANFYHLLPTNAHANVKMFFSIKNNMAKHITQAAIISQTRVNETKAIKTEQ